MGHYAFKALEIATQDLLKGKIDALVTAPVNKNLVNNDDAPFKGHTEYLTEQSKATESVMLLVSDKLKVGLVTNHIPIKDVARNITPAAIVQKLRIMDHSLRKDFGILRPRIAVLALNPHAGDDGLIGIEEQATISPAIEHARRQENMLVFGPFPADGFFGSHLYAEFDAVLAMYHDQGLVPFKALSFGHGVNFTAGLPIVRTSPDLRYCRKRHRQRRIVQSCYFYGYRCTKKSATIQRAALQSSPKTIEQRARISHRRRRSY